MKKVRSNSVMPRWSAFEAALKDAEIIDNGSSITEEELLYFFDPNDRRYRCCCQQNHSITGVRVIAGMLCATVFLELCQLCWRGLSRSDVSEYDEFSTVQIGIGAATSISVLCALWRENAAFLLPYLLLQAFGLTAVFVILFAMLYIMLSNDLDAIRSFFNSHSPDVVDSYNQRYLIYMGWTMIGSCLILLALQWWLISIVFACWRYFRDKHNFGYKKEFYSSSVFRHSRPRFNKLTNKLNLKRKSGLTEGSKLIQPKICRSALFDLCLYKLQKKEENVRLQSVI